jgi:hypothetical protein
MSHWHRSPASFSLAKLLSRRTFILDQNVSGDLASCFPKNVSVAQPKDVLPEPSRQKLATMCYTRRSVLVTADREFTLLLTVETKQVWGVLLLPDDPACHAEVLRRVLEGRLVFRPSVEPTAMVEIIAQNRFLLDVSRGDPLLSVFCGCRWAS